MKAFKRIISLLLALVLTLSIGVIAFAADEDPDTDKGSEKVATLYLMISLKNKKEPHVWLYFINTSDHAIMVGQYKVAKGEHLSVGSWDDRGSGKGIHYNLERYMMTVVDPKKEVPEGEEPEKVTKDYTTSIHTTITATQLSTISAAFDGMNHWDYYFNCNYFAVTIWNLCSPRMILHLGTPYLTRFFMFIYLGNKKFEMQKLTNWSKVKKHTSDGLQPVTFNASYTRLGI